MRTFIFYIFMAAALAAPQQAKALTIEEAVGLALKNNHAIKRTAFEYDSARHGVGESRAGFLPSLTASYTYAESSENAYGGQNGSSVGTVTAAYNVFRGYRDTNSELEARARASAARYQARSMRAEVALAARMRYTEVLRAEGALKTATEGVGLLRRQRSDAELFYREGLIARNELLKVAVELAIARQNLLEAKGGYTIALRSLEKTIGTEVPEGEELVPLTMAPETMEMDTKAMEGELLENRSELKYLRKSREAYDHAASVAGGAMLPSVDLSVSFSKYGDSPTIGGRDNSYDSATVSMITASWTLFDGMRSYNSRSRLRYMGRAAWERLRETEDELLLQLKIATEDYAIAREKLVVAETAVSQADENYRVTDLQFKERVATTTDLLDARTYLTDAKDRYNNALYDIHVARATIDRVLERNLPEPESANGHSD